MKHYLSILGHNQDLSIAELESIIPALIKEDSPAGLFYFSTAELNPVSLINRLGGTKKLAELIATVSVEDLVSSITPLMTNNRFEYSLTNLDHTSDETLARKLKHSLKEKGISARFVSSTTGTGVQPILITNGQVVDLLYSPKSSRLYQTKAVSDYHDWTRRDREKPFIMPQSGMLPPKLARIMVNLGLGEETHKVLLDPFCGSGTVLMEGALVGASCIGSDLDATRLAGTNKNLTWLKSFNPQIADFTLYQSDATHISSHIETAVDAIVTEPLLGPPHPERTNLKNLVKGLDKLYLGSLKNWSKFLQAKARVVMVMPHFSYEGHEFRTGRFIDTRENLGYNLLRSDLFFTRPKDGIKRQIIILEKQ